MLFLAPFKDVTVMHLVLNVTIFTGGVIHDLFTTSCLYSDSIAVLHGVESNRAVEVQVTQMWAEGWMMNP